MGGLRISASRRLKDLQRTQNVWIRFRAQLQTFYIRISYVMSSLMNADKHVLVSPFLLLQMFRWPRLLCAFVAMFLDIIEGMARYAGQLLGPAEGLSQGFFFGHYGPFLCLVGTLATCSSILNNFKKKLKKCQKISFKKKFRKKFKKSNFFHQFFFNCLTLKIQK